MKKISILFLFSCQVVVAQLYNFKTYSLEEGLSQSQVIAIYQDPKGNLWVGTNGGGLNKYNGLEFKNYTVRNGLPNNNILTITGDDLGNIWVGTESGLCRFDGRKFFIYSSKSGLVSDLIYCVYKDKGGDIWIGTPNGVNKIIAASATGKNPLQVVKITVKDGIANDTVYSIMQDREGNMWLGTRGGASQLKQDEEGKFNIKNYTKKDGLISSGIWTITQDNNGEFWMGSGWGLSHVIFKNDEIYKVTNYDQDSGLVHNYINTIVQDHKGDIWLATVAGLSKIVKNKSNGRTAFISYTAAEGLSHDYINCLMEDREGNLWLGTDNGMSKYSGNRFCTFSVKDGLADNPIWGIEKDNEGAIWFATSKGISRLHPEQTGNKITSYTQKDGLLDDDVSSIYNDKEGNLWFGTRTGVSRVSAESLKKKKLTFTNYTKKDGLDVNLVTSIIQDSKDNFWFTSFNGLYKFNGEKFTHYNEKNGLASDKLYDILEDGKDYLWIATEEGISKFDGQLFTNYTKKNGLLNSGVSSILEDKKGNLWFCSLDGGGIYRYDGKKFKAYTEEDGLCSNTVYLIEFDGEGNMWIGTNKGLDKLLLPIYEETGKLVFKHYAKNEGFTGIECNQNAVHADKDNNNMWFGTVNGAIQYDPHEDEFNKVPPTIFINGLQLFNKKTDWSLYSTATDSVSGLPVETELPYDKNYITFKFQAISLTIQEKVRYRYKLEGLDEDWSEETPENYANYTSLPPGTYTFLVKACNNDGVWNEQPSAFNFTVTPPWWETKAFYSLSIIMGLGSIWGFTRWRTHRLYAAKKMLEEKIEERTQELHEKNIELEKLSIVASETDNAIAITHPSGEIEWINESLEKKWGCTLQEMRDQGKTNVFTLTHNIELAEIIEGCVREKQSTTYEALVAGYEGVPRWIHTTLTPILDNAEKVKKLVFIDTDITELKMAEETIKQKNKDIMDSIQYAKRIQDATLPPKEKIIEHFPESFTLYMPREVVSGDFYWYHIEGDRIYMAACDCTGHGVPGAFMSLIGTTILNEIILQKKMTDPASILDCLNREVRISLKQNTEGAEAQDGMDIALCVINRKTNELCYAGALRPLYLIRKKPAGNGTENAKYITMKSGEYFLTEVKPDKHSIGGLLTSQGNSFTNHTFQLDEGDTIYIFSDGYADQFGGEKGKKITNKRFKDFLLSIQDKPLVEQEKFLATTLLSWKGDIEQIDDILVLGVRI